MDHALPLTHITIFTINIYTYIYIYKYKYIYYIHIYIDVYIYIYIYTYTYQPSCTLDFAKFSGHILDPFLYDLEYLPHLLCVFSLLYSLDALGTESISLSVNRAICRNSENIEPYNIARQIKYKYSKQKKLVLFVKKLTYKYIIPSCYV